MDYQFLTQTAITERAGWSLGLVKKLLGEPDQRKKVYGRSIPLALYALDRVAQAEASIEFQEYQTTLAKRRAAAEKAVATKTQKLLAAIQSMPVVVDEWPLHKAQAWAIDRYNDRNEGMSVATKADAPDFLARITVNFIRHELTTYDLMLWDAAGKTGIREAVIAIRKKIYDAIGHAYPMLQAECHRQFELRCTTDI